MSILHDSSNFLIQYFNSFPRFYHFTNAKAVWQCVLNHFYEYYRWCFQMSWYNRGTLLWDSVMVFLKVFPCWNFVTKISRGFFLFYLFCFIHFDCIVMCPYSSYTHVIFQHYRLEVHYYYLADIRGIFRTRSKLVVNCQICVVLLLMWKHVKQRTFLWTR